MYISHQHSADLSYTMDDLMPFLKSGLNKRFEGGSYQCSYLSTKSVLLIVSASNMKMITPDVKKNV